jgi:hypothetical protein
LQIKEIKVFIFIDYRVGVCEIAIQRAKKREHDKQNVGCCLIIEQNK